MAQDLEANVSQCPEQDHEPATSHLDFKVPAKGELEEEIRLADLRNLGLVMHKFSSGLIMGAINAILTGLLLGYLNVPAYLQNVAINVANLPNLFTCLFGMISDSKPIFGLRRKPYMIIGNALVFLFLVAMSIWPIPPSYYCHEADGTYLIHKPPCNPDAKNQYMQYVLFLGLIGLGLVIGDSACAGLLVEYAKMEPEARRGSLQAKLEMVYTLATLISKGIAAFGFNGKMYLGSWDQREQLNFHQYCFILSCSAGLALVLCCLCLQEPGGKTISSSKAVSPLCEQVQAALMLFKTKAFFFVCMYVFASSSIFSISTPADSWVGIQWAGTRMLQRQLASMLGKAASLLGFWLFTKYLLNVSWRKIVAVTVLSTTVIDAVPQVCAIFGIFRNQYFYLGEPIVSEIPRAAQDLINIILANEISSEANCGLVAGIIATVQSLGDPLSVVLSNQIFGLFKPGLSNRENYIADTPIFRRTVGMSYGLSYLFSVLSLILLPLLPWQKVEAQQRKQEWPSSSRYAVMLLTLFALAFVYSLLVDFISLVPEWACLEFVGGQGC